MTPQELAQERDKIERELRTLTRRGVRLTKELEQRRDYLRRRAVSVAFELARKTGGAG